MAQSKPNCSSSSSRSDGYTPVPATVLASCYAMDASPAATLTGLHYCTTPAAGPECPPLAAITAAHQLTLLPKKRQQPQEAAGRRHAAAPAAAGNGRRRYGAGGATFRIREECERLFCETMAAVFPGERNTAGRVSGLTGVLYDDDNNHEQYKNGYLLTPPDEPVHGGAFAARRRTPSDASSDASSMMDVATTSTPTTAALAVGSYAVPVLWLEIWDFVGGGSFRAFVAEDGAGDRSLFVFFDASLFSREVKQALVALIELGETLACAHIVLCVDRAAPAEAAAGLLKGLQWAGFSLTTLDLWTGGAGVDVTSDRWLFMGMEL